MTTTKKTDGNLEKNQIISFHQVSKKFGNQIVLEACGLEINRGDRIAMIGQNGAGKTTLIRCLLGQYKFDGTINVDGLDPRRNRVDVLEKITYVPQIPPPIQMSVGELLQFSSQVAAGLTIEAIKVVADDLNLDIAANWKKPFVKLSGGMKQKLLISIALARQPKILVMDEPAANLDPQGREAFIARLQKIPDDMVLLLSSHRVDELLGLVNREIEMDCGKVIKDRLIVPTESNVQTPVSNGVMNKPIKNDPEMTLRS